MPVRLLLVDDHPAFRAGVSGLLGTDPELSVVAEASDGSSARASALELRPDMVLMDLSLPDQRGVDVTRDLVAQLPGIKILGLSAHEEPAYARAMLDAGAAGYVLKRSACDDLIRAVKAVAKGGTYVDPAIARSLMRGHSRASSGVGVSTDINLSEREIQVIRLVASGHTAKEMADDLGVSPRTLETYRARAMSKLNLRSRAELIRYALRSGWLRDG